MMIAGLVRLRHLEGRPERLGGFQNRPVAGHNGAKGIPACVEFL
jgi:hypothetical protein